MSKFQLLVSEKVSVESVSIELYSSCSSWKLNKSDTLLCFIVFGLHMNHDCWDNEVFSIPPNIAINKKKYNDTKYETWNITIQINNPTIQLDSKYPSG